MAYSTYCGKSGSLVVPILVSPDQSTVSARGALAKQIPSGAQARILSLTPDFRWTWHGEIKRRCILKLTSQFFVLVIETKVSRSPACPTNPIARVTTCDLIRHARDSEPRPNDISCRFLSSKARRMRIPISPRRRPAGREEGCWHICTF